MVINAMEKNKAGKAYSKSGGGRWQPILSRVIKEDLRKVIFE